MSDEVIRYAIEEIRLYASNYQFYVQDSDPRGSAGDDSFWTTAAHDNRVAVTDGIVGLGTGSYAHVKVRVEVDSAKPPMEMSDWDHVTEAGLHIRSKLLLVEGCLACSGMFFHVQPGNYRVRCCAAGLAASVDGGDNAGDSYFLQIWPAKPAPPRVLKRWLGESADEHLAALEPELQAIVKNELARGNEVVRVDRDGTETGVVFSRPFQVPRKKLPPNVTFRRETDPMGEFESYYNHAVSGSLACRRGN